MTLVFDTSAFSKILDEDALLISVASSNKFTDYILPLAADAELRFGFKNGNQEKSNLMSYEPIKQLYNLRIVAPDQDTAIIYADLATWCRQNGISLSNNDLWVAATCVQVGGKLLATDHDFAHLPQVSLVTI